MMSRSVFLIGGLVLFAAILTTPAPGGMSPAAWKTAAVMGLMALWWLGEVMPVSMTALLPILLFPVLGVMPIGAASAPYADPLIFLFLGGFMLALALEKWNVHRRIALLVMGLVGTRPAALVAGFMAAAALLSMWVSNTATAAMMLPIALSVIGLRLMRSGSARDDNLAIALLLGIAYGASIGGLGTLIGTPPNALLAAYARDAHDIDIGFGAWMAIGIPAVVVLLPIAWLTLTRLAYPLGREPLPNAALVLATERAELGAMCPGGRRVLGVFAATAFAWIARPTFDGFLPGYPISDSSIVLTAAIALFLLPAGGSKRERLMDWEAARNLPWGTLLLFGGGLSLAHAMDTSGLAAWIGAAMAQTAALDLILILLIFVAVVVFLTEFASNTATAAVFIPIVSAFAAGMGAPPLLFAVPVALAASCAFMMPVATPPNAIVHGSGRISIPQMARAGLILNLFAIAALTAGAYLGVLIVYGSPL